MPSPTGLSLDRTSVAEGMPGGAVVGRLSAADPDAGESFTYALVQPSNIFEIVGNELRLKAGASLDYETTSSYGLTIRVTDRSGNSYSEPFTITAGNLHEISGTELGETLQGTVIADLITGGGGNDVLQGGEGVDLLDGGTDSDELWGGGGADTLLGGAGADYLEGETDDLLLDGGDGNDEIWASVWDPGITGHGVRILGGAGDDSVKLYFSVVLNQQPPALVDGGDGYDTLVLNWNHGAPTPDLSMVVNFERIGLNDSTVLTDALAPAGATLTIHSLGLEIVVDGSAETDAHLEIFGYGWDLGGDDEGGDGSSGWWSEDVFIGGQLSDLLRGGEGDDMLKGNAGDDLLDGGEGNDTLDGGVGQDEAVFSGTRANYLIVQNGDGSVSVTDLNNGSPDGVDRLASVERLRFTDALVGSDATLINRAPTDITVQGGSVQESAAAGTVVAALGAADPDAGEAFSYGLAGALGVFEIVGNQIRVVAGAQIDYEARSSYPVTLTVTDSAGFNHSENFVIQVGDVEESTPPVSPPVTPPAPSPVLTGDGGNNTLTGTGGNDAMSGGGGNDTLLGGTGNDDLWGGKGRDTLTGGAGADTFIFTKLTDSGSSKTTRDTITDFGGKDEIDLRLIDAVVGQKGNQAFDLDRGGPFEAGEIRQSKVTGGLLLEMNVDGDARAEMSIFLKGVSSPLSDGDFVF